METTVKGKVVFVRLADHFSLPRWREGLVVSGEGHWAKVIVRASERSEIDEGLAQFKIGSHFFFLFSSPLEKLRAACSQECLKLEEDHADILTEARSLISSESELHYATASDRPPRARGGRDQKEKADSSSDDSSSGSEADLPLHNVLSQMRRRWQEDGTGGEKAVSQRDVAKKTSRYPLLAKGDKPQKNSEKTVLEDPSILLQGLQEGGDPLKALLTFQVVQSMQRDQKRRKSRRDESASSRSSTDSSASSVEETTRRRSKGHAKAIEDYRAGKRRMFRRPMHHVKKYVKEIERSLGAKDRPFRLSEAGKKVPWGKQKGLQRAHYMFSEVLEMLLKGKTEKACLQVVLCLRALHQAALDQDWSVAWMLCHLEDPFSKPKWGGDAEELGHIAAYLKSMAELEKNTERLRSTSSGSADRVDDAPLKPPKIPKPKPKSKGNGKGEEIQWYQNWLGATVRLVGSGRFCKKQLTLSRGLGHPKFVGIMHYFFRLVWLCRMNRAYPRVLVQELEDEAGLTAGSIPP